MMEAAEATPSPVSGQRLDDIRRYITARAPLVAKGTKITVDEKDIDCLLPEAIEAYPSLKESFRNSLCWLWGAKKTDPHSPQQRQQIKKSLMDDFNRAAAADLPFPAEELEQQPAAPKRHLIMAEPLEVTYDQEEEGKAQIYLEWFCLRHALLKAGAQVEVIPQSSATGGMREVYTRDRYIMIGETAYLPDPHKLERLHDAGDVDTGEQDIDWYKGEIAQVKEALEARGVKTVTVKGAWFEGGNVIRHTSSRTLFAGIDGEWASESSAQKLVEAINRTQDEKWTLLPVPLTNAEEMYHLDTGMSEELPNGEVMISPLLTDKKTYKAIVDIVGEKNIIKLTNKEARKLATNMIDVGDTLVMTGNCDTLGQTLKEKGYTVVQPSDYGQEDFEFGLGGVHCMTNDIRQPRRKIRGHSPAS